MARCLSTHQASLPPNTVYIYHPLCHSLVSRERGGVAPQGPAPSSPLARPSNHARRPPVRPLCKASAKRKVEEMEVDEFYDGIKRLYNEDSVQEAVEGQGPACSASLVRQEGSGSPCPPLQPVPVT